MWLSLGLKDSHIFSLRSFLTGLIWWPNLFPSTVSNWLPTHLAFSDPAKKQHSGFSPDFYPHTHPGSSSFTYTETYTDANVNTVLTHPTKKHCEMTFSPLQVWYPFTLPIELPTEGSMEPEQKDRETNRARQTC